MTYEEKTMKSDKLYEGKIINLRIDTVELPDKKYSKREIVEHPGGVAIVGVTDENEILLVRQYRKAVDKILLELPAGKIEVNEEPKETALKELKEETGYSTEKLEYLLEFYTSPGFSTEKVYIFLAEDMQKANKSLNQGSILMLKVTKLTTC